MSHKKKKRKQHYLCKGSRVCLKYKSFVNQFLKCHVKIWLQTSIDTLVHFTGRSFLLSFKEDSFSPDWSFNGLAQDRTLRKLICFNFLD